MSEEAPVSQMSIFLVINILFENTIRKQIIQPTQIILSQTSQESGPEGRNLKKKPVTMQDQHLYFCLGSMNFLRGPENKQSSKL